MTLNRTEEDPEHHGYRIRLRRNQVDWIGFVTRPGQRPIVILAPDKDALIVKAQALIRERFSALATEPSGRSRS